ncbi:MAG: isoprenylcysteine carboxylmethyltransferase family protein [Dehalococcoidales bacterium]|nr:isoprenylcysteine carboxylmethyltransferase family protein [Dehalococcoidales bacterium]
MEQVSRQKVTYRVMLALMLLLLGALGLSVLAFIVMLVTGQNEMFSEAETSMIPWGPWGQGVTVAAAVLIFTFFTLGYILPLGRRDWRSAGAFQAFIIALFTEMFGIPLTVYVLSGAFGGVLSLKSGDHLLARGIATLTSMDVETAIVGAMALSLLMLMAALTLIFWGWKEIYNARGQLVTGGIYRHLRHPQYAGIWIFIAAWLVQWPTIITILLAPVLFLTYYWLCRREEAALAKEFGDEYQHYRQRVPMFLPRLVRKED